MKMMREDGWVKERNLNSVDELLYFSVQFSCPEMREFVVFIY